MTNAPAAHPFPFLTMLKNANPCLAGVKEFHFYPGMLFGSREKWWPDSGRRPTSHEGVDICLYSDGTGAIRNFTPAIRIPAMAPGRLLASCRDFLGRSLFIDHCLDGPAMFLSVYAHIVPAAGLAIGQKVRAGEIIGTVADTAGRKNRMPVHLHISLLEIPGTVLPVTLDWDGIHASETLRLIDPMPLLGSEAIHVHADNPWKEKELAAGMPEVIPPRSPAPYSSAPRRKKASG